MITKILSVAPEFAVLFDVSYIDTELAAKLAALSSAVKAGDSINVSKHSKAISAEVAKQVTNAIAINTNQSPKVKAASADKSPSTPEKAATAQKAATQVLDAAKDALAARIASDISAPAFISREAALHKSSLALQDAVRALPAGPTTTTHLIKAAQDLSKKLQLLLNA